MKRILLTVAVVMSVLFWLPAYAQAQIPSPAPNASGNVETLTKVEKAIKRQDKLMAQEFYRYGEVGEFNVSSVIVYTPDDTTAERVYGIMLEIQTGKGFLGFMGGFIGMGGQKSRTYIDYDEISFLIGALSTVEKFAAQLASRDVENTDVIYSLKNGSQFGFTQRGRGQTAFAIFPGMARGFSMDDMKNLNKYLQQAQARLREMGAK